MNFINKRPDRVYWSVNTYDGSKSTEPATRTFFARFEDAIAYMVKTYPRAKWVENLTAYKSEDGKVRLKHAHADRLLAIRLSRNTATGQAFRNRTARMEAICESFGIPRDTGVRAICRILRADDPLMRALIIEEIRQQKGQSNE